MSSDDDLSLLEDRLDVLGESASISIQQPGAANETERCCAALVQSICRLAGEARAPEGIRASIRAAAVAPVVC